MDNFRTGSDVTTILTMPRWPLSWTTFQKKLKIYCNQLAFTFGMVESGPASELSDNHLITRRIFLEIKWFRSGIRTFGNLVQVNLDNRIAISGFTRYPDGNLPYIETKWPPNSYSIRSAMSGWGNIYFFDIRTLLS
jgi:hypothetical protein